MPPESKAQIRNILGHSKIHCANYYQHKTLQEFNKNLIRNMDTVRAICLYHG